MSLRTSSCEEGLEDWGFRAGAGPGECKLRGKMLSEGNGVEAGIWEWYLFNFVLSSCKSYFIFVFISTPGAFSVIDRVNTESIHILSGRVRLTDLKENTSRELCAGDCATLELGSNVRWEILETVTKFFVIVKHVPLFSCVP